MLIGIMSKKDSILYKASDIKLIIPEGKKYSGFRYFDANE
jgi:D-arabinose 5-phosphate isomerase GutQ